MDDLNSNRLTRAKGKPNAPAECERTHAGPPVTEKMITVYDFSKGAVFKRLLSEVDCDNDVGKVSYSLFTLGSVLPSRNPVSFLPDLIFVFPLRSE